MAQSGAVVEEAAIVVALSLPTPATSAYSTSAPSSESPSLMR